MGVWAREGILSVDASERGYVGEAVIVGRGEWDVVVGVWGVVAVQGAGEVGAVPCQDFGVRWEVVEE